MRYAPDHKEKTHERIVAAAAAAIRRDGIVATGVVGLMKDVGLTQGGFYAHFESKQVLVREAAVAAIAETAAGLRRVADAAGVGAPALRAVIESYLSDRHLRSAERGCGLAAIGAELAREPEATRAAFAAATDALVALIAEHLPAGTRDPSRRARTVLGLMSGVLQYARLQPDAAQCAAMLADGRRAAIGMCGIASTD